ncbi:hypothetical protein C8R46DRAFT_1031012 [Mycena filopes]|nr:hypothetical protein C8R46DRAFT_1031012 [Mycena filopes]
MSTILGENNDASNLTPAEALAVAKAVAGRATRNAEECEKEVKAERERFRTICKGLAGLSKAELCGPVISEADHLLPPIQAEASVQRDLGNFGDRPQTLTGDGNEMSSEEEEEEEAVKGGSAASRKEKGVKEMHFPQEEMFANASAHVAVQASGTERAVAADGEKTRAERGGRRGGQVRQASAPSSRAGHGGTGQGWAEPRAEGPFTRVDYLRHRLDLQQGQIENLVDQMNTARFQISFDHYDVCAIMENPPEHPEHIRARADEVSVIADQRGIIDERPADDPSRRRLAESGLRAGKTKGEVEKKKAAKDGRKKERKEKKKKKKRAPTPGPVRRCEGPLACRLRNGPQTLRRRLGASRGNWWRRRRGEWDWAGGGGQSSTARSEGAWFEITNVISTQGRQRAPPPPLSPKPEPADTLMPPAPDFFLLRLEHAGPSAGSIHSAPLRRLAEGGGGSTRQVNAKLIPVEQLYALTLAPDISTRPFHLSVTTIR